MEVINIIDFRKFSRSVNDNLVIAQPDRKGFALTSFIIGIAGLVTMLIPIINIPAQISGLIFGILGRKSSKKSYFRNYA